MEEKSLNIIEELNKIIFENPDNIESFTNFLNELPILENKIYKEIINILPSEKYKKIFALYLIKNKKE